MTLTSKFSRRVQLNINRVYYVNLEIDLYLLCVNKLHLIRDVKMPTLLDVSLSHLFLT